MAEQVSATKHDPRQDSRSLANRFWRSLRNPSIPLVLAAIVVAIAIPSAIFGPRLWKTGLTNWQEQRRLTAPPIVGVAPGTWINRWLRDQADRMMNADSPAEWRSVNFQLGPCYPENLSQLPNNKWSAAVVTGCQRMQEIQQKYAGDCISTSECRISSDARRELAAMSAYLVAEYEDSGMVIPYNLQEQKP